MSYLTGDEEQKRLEYLRERWEQDRISDLGEAKEEGREEGENNKVIELAMKMINRGDNVEDISDFLEISTEQVQELMKEAC